MAGEAEKLETLSDAKLVAFLRQQPRPSPAARTGAYQVIAEHHQADILRYLAGKLDDAGDVDDVGQTTFTDAIASLERQQWPAEPAKLGGWLMEIAKRRVLAHYKRRPMHRKEITFEDDALAQLPDRGALGDKRDPVRLAEVHRRLADLVASFPQEEQDLYQLRIIDQLSPKEIANRWNKPQKTISNRATLLSKKIAQQFPVLILTQGDRTRCPDLTRILDKHADTVFTKELHDEVVQHYRTCPTCGDCAVCRREIALVAYDYAPALISVISAAAFREQIAQTVTSTVNASPTAAHQPSAGSSTRTFIGAVAATIGLLLFVGGSNPPSPNPPSPTQPANPSLRPVADVRPCGEQLPENPGPGGRVPATTSLPRPVSLPAGAAVAGTRVGWGSTAQSTYILGPANTTCQTRRAADGGTFIAMQPADRRSGVFERWQAGGAVEPAILSCGVIPQIEPLAKAAVGGGDPGCARPPGAAVQPVATGTPNFYAALVHSAHEQWDGSENPRHSITALYVAHVFTHQGQQTANGKAIFCSLPDRQDDICTASLSLFLAQTAKAVSIKPADYERATRTIRDFVQHYRA